MQPPTVSTPNLVALLEDRLGGGGGFRDQVFGVEGVPEKFGALEARQEFGLGNAGLRRRGSIAQTSAAHVLLIATFAVIFQAAGSVNFISKCPHSHDGCLHDSV